MFWSRFVVYVGESNYGGFVYKDAETTNQPGVRFRISRKLVTIKA